MDDAAFIIGLMKTETDALGFIPSTAIRLRWILKGRYIIQSDRRGRRRGYLLHGPTKYGKPLYVNQVCIEYDHRLRGYALLAVRELLTRAHDASCSAINLRCAADLSANWFWLAVGFQLISTDRGGSRRRRRIFNYRLNLQLPSQPVVTPQKIPIQRVFYYG